MQRRKEAGQLDMESRRRAMAELAALEACRRQLDEAPAEEMDCLRAWFARETEKREQLGEETGTMFDNVFRCLEKTFGDSQELVIFVTEITAGNDTSWFVEQFGCEAYFRHNRELLFDDSRLRLREELREMKGI